MFKIAARFVVLVSGVAAIGQDQRVGPLNQELPSWLTLTFQSRYRSEGQHDVNFQDGNNRDFLYQRYRLGVGIKPFSWLSFYAEGQDSRAFGLTPTSGADRDTFDLRQAYVVVGRPDHWWDLKVGRQRLLFGSERVMGATEWGNVPRVYDAARLAIHKGKNRVDMFASSPVVSDQDNWDHHQQGNNLYGAYGSIGSWVKNARVEPYFLFRTSPGFAGEPGQRGTIHGSTYGLRFAGGIAKPWSYETEAIGQTGTIGTAQLRASAYLAQLNYKFTQVKWTPTLATEYNYASGDNKRGDNMVNTFDQLYPTNHLIYGVVDQQGRRNAENVRGGLKLQPRKWLAVRAEQRWLWLASRNDALYLFNGAVSVPAVAGGAKYRDVGHEFDLIGDITSFQYTAIGIQWGYLTPGKFLKTYSAGSGRMFYCFYVDFKL
ncbi:MAG: alginate export family protein [Acidobacteria bacterium]|nr:alginate export family protein [Acidobacteriota bacterium]